MEASQPRLLNTTTVLYSFIRVTCERCEYRQALPLVLILINTPNHSVVQRFNIGISSIKLARYHEAGRYVLDAIRLQHATASEAYSSSTGSAHVKGVTSDILWQTLRTACMQ